MFYLLYEDIYASGYTNSGIFEDVFSKILIGIFGLLFICYILSIIGQWKIFKKAGKSGFAALIPIYNIYTLCQVVGVNPWWIVITFIAGVTEAFIPALSIFTTLVTVYFGVLIAVSTARSFGKSDGYAVGIYFFGFIFYLILGFGSSEYLGPKPMNDILFKDKNSFAKYNIDHTNLNNSVTEVTDSVSRIHYCPSCGYQLAIDTRYCPNCGKEL